MKNINLMLRIFILQKIILSLELQVTTAPLIIAPAKGLEDALWAASTAFHYPYLHIYICIYNFFWGVGLKKMITNKLTHSQKLLRF